MADDTPAPGDADALKAEIAQALKEGSKIAAVKRVHERTGLGLAEAKRLVDEYAAELHRRHPGDYPDPKAGGCGKAALWLFAAASTGAAGAYAAFSALG